MSKDFSFSDVSEHTSKVGTSADRIAIAETEILTYG